MKTFIVASGDWQTEVEVSEEIFETYDAQAQEAIALGLEEWIEDGANGAYVDVGLFTSTWEARVGETEEAYAMYNKYAFENIGRPDLAAMFQENTDD